MRAPSYEGDPNSVRRYSGNRTYRTYWGRGYEGLCGRLRIARYGDTGESWEALRRRSSGVSEDAGISHGGRYSGGIRGGTAMSPPVCGPGGSVSVAGWCCSSGYRIMPTLSLYQAVRACSMMDSSGMVISRPAFTASQTFAFSSSTCHIAMSKVLSPLSYAACRTW